MELIVVAGRERYNAVDDSRVSKIRKLLKERNGILLAHNYQRPEVQDIADLTGDSLELSIKASKTNADLIVFCGVHFMAETASIVSPQKTILLPRLDAGCPMADMITPVSLADRLGALGDMPVVTYVNSSAEVKAHSTICCTSANVVAVVNSLESDEAFLTPDRNLAQYAASKTDKKIHYWDGYCPIHDRLSVDDVLRAKEAHPGALLMAHPECRPEVLALADAVLSTSGMLAFARESDHNSFLVGTESGLIHPLQKENPQKTFHHVAEHMVCEDMKKTTLDDVLRALEGGHAHEVKVPEDVRERAVKAVEKMLAIPKG